VREVADAYNFHLVGTETLGGRDAWVIDATPRPGYEPHMKDAKFLPKFRFRAWIDKTDAAVDQVGYRLHRHGVRRDCSWRASTKARASMIEQTRVNDEVWLPQHVGLKIDARLALLKEYHVELEQTFRDYKRFRATTKILAVEDVQKK
jgi:hypothetical protein